MSTFPSRRVAIIATSAVLLVMAVLLVRGQRWSWLKGQTTTTYPDGYNEVLLDTDPELQHFSTL
jgi:hypothetical protein